MLIQHQSNSNHNPPKIYSAQYLERLHMHSLLHSPETTSVDGVHGEKNIIILSQKSVLKPVSAFRSITCLQDEREPTSSIFRKGDLFVGRSRNFGARGPPTYPGIICKDLCRVRDYHDLLGRCNGKKWDSWQIRGIIGVFLIFFFAKKKEKVVFFSYAC